MTNHIPCGAGLHTHRTNSVASMSTTPDALQTLTALKRQRFAACAELQRRTSASLTFTRSDALELLAIETPRQRRRNRRTADVIITHHNHKRKLRDVRFLVWNGPLQITTVKYDARELRCTTAVCTWAHYSSALTVQELVVLGDSMMRRNKRLARTDLSEFTAYLEEAKRSSTTPRLFRGYRNCLVALALMREGTDSSQETRTRLALRRYGLPDPEINHKVKLPNGKTVFLDMAYPELRIAIEYDGNYHRFDGNQVLQDDKRREALEELGWIYIKVTVLDLRDEASEEALAQRVASRMEAVLGVPVPLVPRMTLRQVADGRRSRKIPIWDRIPRSMWAVSPPR